LSRSAPATLIGVSDSVPEARLRFVTGKGGVGKTTVAAAYATLAATHGRRVLAVDTVNRGDLAPRIEVVSGRLGGPGPTVLGLTTKQALDEYIKRYLRVPIAPSSLGPVSRIFDFVSTAAPGVREILTVGKIGYEAVYGPWDDVVVDAPASGHVIELLSAPASLRRLAPTGPLASQTLWLQELLESDRTAITVVATPEELPVAETDQLLKRLRDETEVAVDTLVINRVPPQVEKVGRALLAGKAPASDDGPTARSIRSLVAVAVDRDVTTRPFVEELNELAEAFGLAVVEIIDDPVNPTDTAAAALADHGSLAAA